MRSLLSSSTTGRILQLWMWQKPIDKRDMPTDPLDLDPTPTKKSNAFDKILRMNQQPCQHMLCICTRLTQAKLITGRHTNSLLKGLIDMWFRPYGAPRVLDSDQEGAFTGDIMRS